MFNLLRTHWYKDFINISGMPEIYIYKYCKAVDANVQKTTINLMCCFIVLLKKFKTKTTK